MRIEIHVFHHHESEQLNRIEGKLSALNQGVHAMSAELDQLKVDVQAETDALAAATLAFTGLSAEIAASKNDPAALQALSDKLKASAASWGAAVVAGTPADPSAAPATP